MVNMLQTKAGAHCEKLATVRISWQHFQQSACQKFGSGQSLERGSRRKLSTLIFEDTEYHAKHMRWIYVGR